MQFRILYEDEWVVAIDKPPGVHAHPPEDERFRIEYHHNALAVLRDQMGHHVYPLHRLDRATSGVLMFGKTSEAASRFAPLFGEGATTHKTYITLVRGLPRESQGTIDSPLKSDSSNELLPARTDYEVVVAKEYPASLGGDADRTHPYRVSLLRVRLHTGRMHQIRRHLKRLGHPVVGDTVHGEGVTNRFMRVLTGDRLLYLKALELKFTHPVMGVAVKLRSKFGPEWLSLFDRLGQCPVV